MTHRKRARGAGANLISGVSGSVATSYVSLMDPLFLFIFWLIAATLWFVIPQQRTKVSEPDTRSKMTQPDPTVTEALNRQKAKADLKAAAEVKAAAEQDAAIRERELAGLNTGIAVAQTRLDAQAGSMAQTSSEYDRLKLEASRAEVEMKALTERRNLLDVNRHSSIDEQQRAEVNLLAALAKERASLQSELEQVRSSEVSLQNELRRSQALTATRVVALRNNLLRNRTPGSDQPDAIETSEGASAFSVPRATPPDRLPLLVECFQNRIAPVTKEFYSLVGGRFLGGPITATRKKPGETIAELQQPGAAFLRVLSETDPQKHFLSFAVNPDSIEAFRTARRVASQKGFDVGWLPIESNAGVLMVYPTRIYKKAPKDSKSAPRVPPIQR